MQVTLVGETIETDVVTYCVTDAHRAAEEPEKNRPSKVYKDVILKGARENKLPPEYIER